MLGRVLFVGTALLAARPLPGWPKTAPRATPAATASTSPNLVRVRWLRSIAGSLGRSRCVNGLPSLTGATNLAQRWVAATLQSPCGRLSERERARRVSREVDQRLDGEERPDRDDERGANREVEERLRRRRAPADGDGSVRPQLQLLRGPHVHRSHDPEV